MKVLGISGRGRDAAAAIAVDGRVIAAASEDSFTRVPGIGYSNTGGTPAAAVAACLATAGLEAADLDALTVVDDGVHADGDDTALREIFGDLPIRAIDALHADAIQAAASSRSVGPVVVCSGDRAAISSYTQQDGDLHKLADVAGAHQLMCAARAIARSLGVADQDFCRGLDRLSNGAEAEFVPQLRAAVAWSDATGIVVDQQQLAALLASFDQPLANAHSMNVRVQQTRRAIAASFTCLLAELLRDAAERVRSQSGAASVVLGGQIFGNPRLNTELRRLIGDDLSQAVVPEASGRALGAALAPAGADRERLDGVALGPAFSDTDIKKTLDSCRLEYVFEPDRPRVLKRVSKMLSQGKVVAWFQGPMAFGPRPMGTRSVLCDPSSRYARHNVNEYLRQVPLDEPLPVAFAPSAAARCLTTAAGSPFVVLDADVKSEWRERLTAALDWRQNVRVHAPRSNHAPELCELLEYHHDRTGVPGLIETNLAGPGEPIACTPREAIKTVYSSAIDALVIGRFILMKDYWLLQAHVD